MFHVYSRHAIAIYYSAAMHNYCVEVEIYCTYFECAIDNLVVRSFGSYLIYNRFLKWPSPSLHYCNFRNLLPFLSSFVLLLG